MIELVTSFRGLSIKKTSAEMQEIVDIIFSPQEGTCIRVSYFKRQPPNFSSEIETQDFKFSTYNIDQAIAQFLEKKLVCELIACYEHKEEKLQIQFNYRGLKLLNRNDGMLAILDFSEYKLAKHEDGQDYWLSLKVPAKVSLEHNANSSFEGTYGNGAGVYQYIANWEAARVGLSKLGIHMECRVLPASN